MRLGGDSRLVPCVVYRIGIIEAYADRCRGDDLGVALNILDVQAASVGVVVTARRIPIAWDKHRST